MCFCCLQSAFCQLSVSSVQVCNAYGLVKNFSFSLNIQVKCTNFQAQRGGWCLPLVFLQWCTVIQSLCLWWLTYSWECSLLKTLCFFWQYREVYFQIARRVLPQKSFTTWAGHNDTVSNTQWWRYKCLLIFTSFLKEELLWHTSFARGSCNSCVSWYIGFWHYA